MALPARYLQVLWLNFVKSAKPADQHRRQSVPEGRIATVPRWNEHKGGTSRRCPTLECTAWKRVENDNRRYHRTRFLYRVISKPVLPSSLQEKFRRLAASGIRGTTLLS